MPIPLALMSSMSTLGKGALAASAATAGSAGAGGGGLGGFMGGGGGGGGGLMDFLKNMSFSYRGSGGQGFGFQGGGQDQERRELMERLMSILEGPQVAQGAREEPVVYVGGTNKRDASSPMASGPNRPGGSLGGFFNGMPSMGGFPGMR
jgi:hypothetical protein